MVAALLVITLVSGLSLGYVNDLTLEPKAKARLAKKVNALNTVLADYDNDPVNEVLKMPSEASADSLEIYPAFKGELFAGAAVTGHSERGYSGPVKVMVGFSPDGSIRDIVVLEQKETPGLGTKMKGASFLRQFRAKNPSVFNLQVKKDGGEVDALAGATISTRAFTEAVAEAHAAFLKYRTSRAITEN
jgi:electron transport complex protein RnfG